MNIPRAEDFKFNRTWIAARDLSLALDKFMERAALDRYQAVQLVLHELAARSLDEIGLRQVSRDVQYRIKGFRADLDAALAQQATRRRAYTHRPKAVESEPKTPSAEMAGSGSSNQ